MTFDDLRLKLFLYGKRVLYVCEQAFSMVQHQALATNISLLVLPLAPQIGMGILIPIVVVE